MSTLFVDTLEPNQNTAITAAAGKLLPAGHVVQVVESTTTQDTAISTANTFFDVGHSLSITPTSATSKIYLSHFAGGIAKVVGGASFGIRLIRDGVVQEYNDRIGYSNDPSYWSSVNWSCIFYDSPATTSQVTYTLEITCLSNASTSGLRYNSLHNVNNTTRLIAMEIPQ